VAAGRELQKLMAAKHRGDYARSAKEDGGQPRKFDEAEIMVTSGLRSG
jgi:hypothetical protein